MLSHPDHPSSSHEHKTQSARLSLAGLPSHTVAGGAGTLKHYLTNASAYRILDGAFVMHSYDHVHKAIDTAHFEYVLADPSGRNRWSCSCQKFALSAKHSCFHTLAAAHLSKSMKASASPAQPVISCDRNKTVWAVLGGQGCFRSIVQLRGNVVRDNHCTLLCCHRSCAVTVRAASIGHASTASISWRWLLSANFRQPFLI